MTNGPNIPTTAFLMSDSTRWAMLMALLDGRALPAGELAYASGVSAQTASSHLAKLLDGGFLSVEKEGRHRYYRLAGAHVAQAIEQLSSIQPIAPTRRKPLSSKAKTLRFARTCYDHLAGQLGVTLARRLEEHGYIIAVPDKQYDVSASGAEWFWSIGLDVAQIMPTRRGLARQCLDWTEREHHLAGPLGTRLLQTFYDNDWLRRSDQPRSVRVTSKGRKQFRIHLGLDTDVIRQR